MAIVDAPQPVEAEARHVLIAEGIVPIDARSFAAFPVHADLELGVVQEAAERNLAARFNQAVVGAGRGPCGQQQRRCAYT